MCRYADKENVILKPRIPPVPAYGDWVECQTLEELEAIRHNSNALHMECLAIR